MFLERLSSVSDRIEGAVALSLVAADGMPVESVSTSPDLDLETVAAELVTLARAIAKEQRELSVGDLRQFTIAGDRLTFVLSRVAAHFWLLAALSPGASLGRARYELKRAELLFEDELD
jgi:predicted regulator of Ras-like GTPase activity (Roadblock/LC7/MglB family)